MKEIGKVFILIGILLVACNGNHKESSKSKYATSHNTLRGAWEVESTVSYENGVPKDTFFLPPNMRMVKLFTQKNICGPINQRTPLSGMPMAPMKYLATPWLKIKNIAQEV